MSEFFDRIKASPLYSPSKKIVVARGKPNAKVMFIAEAPGVQEDKEGKPFVGKSGQLLDKAIVNAGIKEYCITNVVPLMPEEEGKIRKPTMEEIEYFKFFTERMITKHNPEIIILMGASAVEGIVGGELKDWVGKRKTANIHGKERTVITLYHPAFHLRQGTQQEFITTLKDLMSLKEINLNVEKVLVEREEDFADWGDVFAFDTETNGKEWKDLLLTDISFCDGKRAFHFSKQKAQEFKEKIQQRILTANKIIGHNLVFDFVVLEKNGIEILRKLNGEQLFDTKVAAWLLDENRNSGLKYLSQTLLGEEMKHYAEVSRGKEFTHYNLHDAIQTYKLYLLFKEQLKEQELEKIMGHEMRIVNPTALMTFVGVNIDKEELEKLKVAVKEDLEKTDKEINAHLPKVNGLFGEVGMQADLNSPQQLSEIIYGKLRVKPPQGEEAGKAGYFSTSTPTLQRIKEAHPIIPLILEHRKLSKLMSSYLEPFLDKFICEGKIHPWFKQYGTVTGRYSSNSPSFQQLPNNEKYSIRDSLIPPQGWKMIVYDYSQIELRMAAIISRDSRILGAYMHGEDLHLLTASQVFDLDVPEYALYKNHPAYKQYKEKYKKERRNAKGVNFCVLYGGGKNRVSELLNCTTAEAEKIIQRFYQAYPELEKKINEVNLEAKKNGELRNLYGRKRRFNGEDRMITQAFNALIQGGSADVLKEAIAKIHERFRDKDDVKMLMTVHDELCFIAKEEKAEEYSKEIKQIMEDFSFPISLLAEGGVGDSYGAVK